MTPFGIAAIELAVPVVASRVVPDGLREDAAREARKAAVSVVLGLPVALLVKPAVGTWGSVAAFAAIAFALRTSWRAGD